MIDRVFTLTLTFALLAGGTLAIGGEFFADRSAPAASQIAQLPRVVVTGSVTPKQTEIARADDSGSESRDGQRTQ